MDKVINSLAASLLFTGVFVVRVDAQPSLPPQNDFYFAAQSLTGLNVSTNGTTVSATAEGGEPAHAGVGAFRSVWYSWVAPASGSVSFDTQGSVIDTVMGIYTGAFVSALTEVGSNDDSLNFPPQSEAVVSVTAGHTYYIAVDGKFGVEGPITLNISTLPSPPANNDFSNAVVLTGLPVSGSGSNVNATAETGEPDHDGSTAATATVWWAWTASTSGVIEVETIDSTFDTLLAVYTGPSVDALSLTARNDDATGLMSQSRLSFLATLGTTYRIAVDGRSGAEGQIDLDLRYVPDPQIQGTVVLTGTEIHLQWSSTTGEDYELFQSSNLVTWTSYTNVLATSSVSTVMAPIQTNMSHVFYYIGTAVND